ncbi:MAG: NAD(P)H-dependent oxidoreductase [Clostridia bacterium]|nr:NAD(P)H-dependent oxidoreductase [Clostridia bacterium]
MTLYINSCVRSTSRTDRIARALLDKLGGEYVEVKLEETDLRPLTEESLARRDALIAEGTYSDAMFDYSKQFASADTIVISAPFWDLSFPSKLKVYFENVYVTGIVTKFSSDGRPVGLCKAKKLYYVTTSGGPYVADFSYGYVKSVAENFFGVGECELIYAENLDIIGADAEAIVDETIKKLRNR